MTIALLTGTFSAYSGIDRVVKQQAKSLVRKGHRIIIGTFAADLRAPSGAGIVIFPSPTHHFSHRLYRLFYPLFIFRWRRDLALIKEAKTIYAHQYPFTFLAWQAKRRFGTHYIFYDHGIPPAWTAGSAFGYIYMTLFTKLASWTMRHADAAISVSKFLQRELLRRNGIRSNVVYNLIDRARFHRKVDGTRIRKKYHLGKAPVLLFVGRLAPYKGVHVLIDAFKLARKKIPAAKLLIVGNPTFPSYFKHLKRKADDHVIFAGYVPDEELPRYYGACDVYATASLWEGYNLPLAEAQACGKPITAFDIGSHPEVTHHGKGHLVPRGDIHGLVSALLEILTAKR